MEQPPPSVSKSRFPRALELERQVLAVLSHRAARNTNELREERLTLGERMADRLASAAGSWRFIIGFAMVLGAWIAANTAALSLRWDPYPFILLNLVLSCLAAIQAPVIMMSQSRLEARDRLRAENDYAVNMKAEVLLEHLTTEVETLKVMLQSLDSAALPDVAPDAALGLQRVVRSGTLSSQADGVRARCVPSSRYACPGD